MVVSLASGASSSLARRKWRNVTLDDNALAILAWYKYAYRLKTYSDAVRLMHSIITGCSEGRGTGTRQWGR
ncbi:MAG: hypothetical protein ACP5KA_07380 [Desulfurococcaceae archaeon]